MIRIVLSLSNYSNLTGSEIYCYELARELANRGNSVMIIANAMGGEIVAKTPKNVAVHHFFDHPDFPADLVISSQPAPTGYSLRFFPHAIHMQVLHSLLSYEEPLLASGISRYIAVRPDVLSHWEAKYPQIFDKLLHIWNGVDTKRFNEKYEKHKNRIPITLFIGTVDHLRRNVITDLVKTAIKDETKLWLVIPHNPFPERELPENITVYPPCWKVEHFVKQCDQTAGIFIGRTTIEGWMCGKPGLVYDVDDKGQILQKATYGVPQNRQMFDITYMADKLLSAYMEVRRK